MKKLNEITVGKLCQPQLLSHDGDLSHWSATCDLDYVITDENETVITTEYFKQKTTVTRKIELGSPQFCTVDMNEPCNPVSLKLKLIKVLQLS